MSRLSAEELAKEISRFVNGASQDDVQELIKFMSGDHPTLQQATMRLACGFIESMANKVNTDLRNQYSKKVANQIIQGYREVEIANVIRDEGFISESYKEFISEKVLPSKNLPFI